MNNPTFSIILPTHNRAHLLSRAITSVLNQTFRDFELLIIDDGATDNTADVVSSFQDRRIKYIYRQSSGGASVARNTGIRKSKGRLITFLDDDDEYLPTFLTENYQLWGSLPADIGFTWCGVRKVQIKDGVKRVVKELYWDQGVHHLTYLNAATSYGLTIRPQCFAKIGLFDESIIGGVEDTELLIRLGSRYKFAIIPNVLLELHLHAGSQLTDASEARAIGYLQILKKHKSFFDKHPDREIRLYRRVVQLYYQIGNRTAARKILWNMVVRRQFQWKMAKSLVCLELFGTEAINLRGKLRLVGQ
ncbi:MAG: glycosyltransferase family 2 protein [Caldilineaceae bacterium]